MVCLCHSGRFVFMVCRSAVCVRTRVSLERAFASAVMQGCVALSSMSPVLREKACCLKLLQKRLVSYVLILCDMFFLGSVLNCRNCSLKSA